MPTIKENIPISPIGVEKYPFNALPLMGSFFVAVENCSLRQLQWRLSACARFRSGKKFTMRTVTEDGKRGVRVWRVQ